MDPRSCSRVTDATRRPNLGHCDASSLGPRRKAMAQERSMSEPMSTEPSMMAMEPDKREMLPGGHLYMQTNEVRNAVLHFARTSTGTITEVERVLTGGAGSGVFKPISGQE